MKGQAHRPLLVVGEWQIPKKSKRDGNITAVIFGKYGTVSLEILAFGVNLLWL
jgi:hypothetical protein